MSKAPRAVRMRWATISIAPATPPRIWVNSSAKAAARLRSSDRVRSIAASLAVVIEAATVVHMARMTMTPTATISIVVARQRRRGSVGKRVDNFEAPRKTEHRGTAKLKFLSNDAAVHFDARSRAVHCPRRWLFNPHHPHWVIEVFGR